MFEEFDEWKISDELIQLAPKEVLVAIYRVAITYGGYSVGTPDENFLAEWHNLWINNRVKAVPPLTRLPDWYTQADSVDEEAA